MLRRTLVLAATVAWSCALTGLAFAAADRALLKEGASLPVDQAADLEAQLAGDPLDMAARTRLLGYYKRQTRIQEASSKAYDRLRSHLLWLIQNEPKSEVLAEDPPMLLLEFNRFLDPDKFFAGRSAFLAHLEKEPNDLTLLKRAADFVSFRDRALAIELGERARSLDSSNPEWTIRLAYNHYNAYRTIRRRSEESPVEAARKALGEFDRAFELLDETRSGGYLALAAEVALAANETAKARKYASLMLNVDRRGSHHYGYNLHYGNITLGKIALAEGDVQRAASYLLLAGSAPGSPKLRARGPDTELAKGLLEQGERDLVLKYIDLCAGFWERGQDRLREWAALVRAGTIPSSWKY